jgi:hypothetical protein
MSYSTSACVRAAASKPRRSSRKSTSPNSMGVAAVVCVVLGCAWTVYANVLRADVYPTLGVINYDAPVVRRSATGAVHKVQPNADATVASLREPALQASASAIILPGPSLSFSERFAASAAQGVDPKQPELARVAEVARPQIESPKVGASPKTKEAAPTQVAALSPAPRPVDTRQAVSPGSAVRGWAERAKAAMMSLAAGEKQTMVEKLWGNQPSTGSLLSFASADASVTGSLDGRQNQNPALGGSAPYDRSTAVYDISARAVYLPDGTKLEAHSGLGSRLDDPRSAHVKMHGVTPPHIYELKPRETLFHGVPALRLTPIGGEEAIFGRSGLLAHTFMLGPNGDSNGCVSFRDYDAFLNAYRNQGIKRLAVVAKVE